MEKKTFVPERKAYLAPAAKLYEIKIEENIMSLTDSFEEEDDDIFVE